MICETGPVAASNQSINRCDQDQHQNRLYHIWCWWKS